MGTWFCHPLDESVTTPQRACLSISDLSKIGLPLWSLVSLSPALNKTFRPMAVRASCVSRRGAEGVSPRQRASRLIGTRGAVLSLWHGDVCLLLTVAVLAAKRSSRRAERGEKVRLR